MLKLNTKIIVASILSMGTFFASAQKKLVFEALGNGIIYSANYENKLFEKDHNLFSVGCYVMPFDLGNGLNQAVGIPLGISTTGTRGGNTMEFGIGLTFLYGYDSAAEEVNGSIREVPLGTAAAIGRLGYRIKFEETFLRFSINPIYWLSRNLFQRELNGTVTFPSSNKLGVTIGIAYGIPLK